MDEEQMRRWVAETLERLGTSGFRAGFTLSAKDRAYALEHGEATVRRHARELLERRVGPAHPAHDGRQTPFRGHPVFTAQHATATCCRGCIAKWHHIPQGRPLTDEELDRLSELTVRWIRRDIARHDPTHGLDQHFLCEPEKIARLVDAAGIREGDRVAELGAGVGTVAAEVPEGASLTLVELDPALCASASPRGRECGWCRTTRSRISRGRRPATRRPTSSSRTYRPSSPLAYLTRWRACASAPPSLPSAPARTLRPGKGGSRSSPWRRSSLGTSRPASPLRPRSSA